MGEGWATEVSTMRGQDRLVMARIREQPPPRANEEPVADLVDYQLRSQKHTSKMASSSLGHPSQKTRVNPRASLHPMHQDRAHKSEAFISRTTLLSSSFRFNKPRFGAALGGLLNTDQTRVRVVSTTVCPLLRVAGKVEGGLGHGGARWW